MTGPISNQPAAGGQHFVCAHARTDSFDGQLLMTLAARPLDLLSVARRAAVAGADAANLDRTLRTYALTFYPNTPLASRAERVAVEKGETNRASTSLPSPCVRFACRAKPSVRHPRRSAQIRFD